MWSCNHAPHCFGRNRSRNKLCLFLSTAKKKPHKVHTLSNPGNPVRISASVWPAKLRWGQILQWRMLLFSWDLPLVCCMTAWKSFEVWRLEQNPQNHSSFIPMVCLSFKASVQAEFWLKFRFQWNSSLKPFVSLLMRTHYLLFVVGMSVACDSCQNISLLFCKKRAQTQNVPVGGKTILWPVGVEHSFIFWKYRCSRIIRRESGWCRLTSNSHFDTCIYVYIVFRLPLSTQPCCRLTPEGFIHDFFPANRALGEEITTSAGLLQFCTQDIYRTQVDLSMIWHRILHRLENIPFAACHQLHQGKLSTHFSQHYQVRETKFGQKSKEIFVLTQQTTRNRYQVTLDKTPGDLRCMILLKRIGNKYQSAFWKSSPRHTQSWFVRKLVICFMDFNKMETSNWGAEVQRLILGWVCVFGQAIFVPIPYASVRSFLTKKTCSSICRTGPNGLDKGHDVAAESVDEESDCFAV